MVLEDWDAAIREPLNLNHARPAGCNVAARRSAASLSSRVRVLVMLLWSCEFGELWSYRA